MERWIAVDVQADAARIRMMEQRRVIDDHLVPLDVKSSSMQNVVDAALPLLGSYIGTNGTMPLICAGADDAPQVPVPCAPPAASQAQDPRLKAYVLPGLVQSRPKDAVGHEIAQISGCMAARPEWDGVLCLPGARSVWVHISAGEIVSFRSFLSPELIKVIAARSSLAPMLSSDKWDETAFGQALGDAMSRPENLAAALASIQVQDAPPEVAHAQVAALLIGMELAAARPYWLGQDVSIVGTGVLAAQYHAALTGQGVPAAILDGDDMMLRGFIRAYEELYP
ncbi:2-dehydro-3-deoxygalactonokinase [uncultured Sulfitobacter sp.]|uniref:2-dehydro-3-deoxygalactonokinase n=1 Tax=uncultured Sulfitobacter sp. TaxID=191468 RepID=UPI0026255A8E|nr:2-dehydro-3-deoxygalactonokinase [uncultured Sulfitobacter sp.]